MHWIRRLIRAVYGHRWTAPITAVAGAVTAITVVISDGQVAVGICGGGLALAVGACLRVHYQASGRPLAQAHEEGRQIGYEAGFRDGQRSKYGIIRSFSCRNDAVAG